MYKIFLILVLLLTACSSQREHSTDISIIVNDNLNNTTLKKARWSPDGKRISYIRDGDLWIHNRKSGKNELVVSELDISTSAWINSTSLMLFNVGSQIEWGDLWMLDLTSGKKNVLMKQVKFTNSIFVHNHSVYLDEHKVGIRKFQQTDPNARPNDVKFPIINGINFKVSPSEDKIAFFDNTIKYDGGELRRVYMSLYDLKTNKIGLINPLKDYTIYGYCWSPDGQFIAFAGETLNHRVPTLYVYKLGSDTPIEVNSIPGNGADMDWSPTTNQVAITTVGQPGRNEILLMNIPNEFLQ